MRFGSPKPRYGPSFFLLISLLFLKELISIFIVYYYSWCSALRQTLKVSPYIIRSADYIFLLILNEISEGIQGHQN